MEWLIALIVIVALFWLLARDYRQKQSRTTEEYEEDVRAGRITGRTMASAGLLELEKVFRPSSEAAQEFAEDEKRGQTKTENEGDTRL